MLAGVVAESSSANFFAPARVVTATILDGVESSQLLFAAKISVVRRSDALTELNEQLAGNTQGYCAVEELTSIRCRQGVGGKNS